MLGLFLTGLVGSASHCAVMCGPFVLAQSAAVMSHTSLGGSELRRLSGAALIPYHFGRVITYVMLGVLLALPLHVMERAAQFRLVPAIALSAAALLFAAAAIGGLGRLNYGTGWATALGARLAAISRPLFENPTGWRGLLIGLLLGFLPCGLLYAAVGASIAPADPLIAAMGMAAFTLGTFPMLWLIAYLGVAAQRRWAGLARKAMPAVAAFNAVVLGWMAWRWFGG
ncbi:MAG TPA: sulfite exporter TauE/SafE family protein [Dongiaceae bacterium]|nr:sulfite exporter TauE/SafE family protein [Dongiaceae bacterium]